MAKAKWFPQPDEAFAFSREGKKILVLIPGGGEAPKQLILDGYEFEYDEEKTEQVRMFIRVAERRRLGEED